MPESVDIPAPVRVTRVRPARRSRAAPTGSARVAELSTCAGLGRLDLAVLGRSGGGEAVEQVARGGGDLTDRRVEGLLVGPGWLRGAADLADVLQRRGLHRVVGGRGREVVEGADVAAHVRHGTPISLRRGPRRTPDLRMVPPLRGARSA